MKITSPFHVQSLLKIYPQKSEVIAVPAIRYMGMYLFQYLSGIYSYVVPCIHSYS